MGWKDNLEDTFSVWARRASDGEEQRCENALNMIRDAIKADSVLKDMDIVFIPKGSYHNNTNVRLNSDVDIAVKLKSVFYSSLPDGMQRSDFRIVDADYTFDQYRNDVERALVNKFGRPNVINGNKAFDIDSNTYRVSADAVPCFEHRRYSRDGTYITGTQFFARNGIKVVNFPEQHYLNGVNKNNATGRRYKRVVRILKRLKAQMVSDNVSGLDNISSFLIECLVWNVPNNFFNHATYKEDVSDVLAYLYHQTKEDNLCREWGEVSELLYLFVSRPYTRQEVNNFILAAYKHVFS